MDHSATFARHFARLVSLLLHDTGNVVEQKMCLRALVTVSKRGVVTLIAREGGGRLFANTESVAEALTGVADVTMQMAAHSVIAIKIGEGSRAADLLGLARTLSEPATRDDGGAAIRRKLAAFGAETIDIATAPARVAAQPAPAASPIAASDAVTVAAMDAPTVVSTPASAPPDAPGVAPPDAPTVPSSPRSMASSDAPTLAVPATNPAVNVAAQDAATLLSQLAAPDVSKLSHAELLETLDSAPNADVVIKTLDDLALLAEHSIRIGKAATVGEIFHGVVTREAKLREGDVKRAYGAAIRRMSKPALLRAVSLLIPKRPEGRQYYYEVLDRTGEEGAEAVIEQITQAPTREDRKALFEVLRELKDAVPALKRMLGDSRWFVVRNAADLLGEMVATHAEGDLVALLRHNDDRVRRSATNALLRLGTPDAMKGIYEAVNDKSPEVRIQATAAIATRKDVKTSHTLIRAIEDEHDGDVQLAMIAALGRIATPDAVQKLVKMAEPEGRLFRKKTTAFRIAAVQALAEARTPAALSALRELAGDKEREVRETATRALAHASR